MLAQKELPNMIPAPLWRRLAAMIYDCFLVISLCFLVGFINLGLQMRIYGSAQLKQITDSGQSLGGPVFYLALLLTIFSFFSYFWTRKGQTLGMQAWRLQVLNSNGQLITLKQSFLRFVVAVPSVLLGFAGMLWVLWSNNNKSWQDHASNSQTYYRPVKR